MKKFLFLGAMAAMLLGTASCSNEMEPEMTDGTVQFKVELPSNVDSRAISDGLTATELQVAVYKEDGTLLDISRLSDNPVTMSGKTATVTFKLVKGLTYKFAFWAQKPVAEGETSPYTFDADNGKVTVNYANALANVDNGDAFSNTATLTVTGPMTETIYLYRPFAQLNYGDVVADYNAAVAAGIDFSKTQVTVKQVATEFDIMNQTTSGDNLVDVTWPAAASAIGENLKVEGVDYKWLSMCYFLVPTDEATVNTELSLLNSKQTDNVFNTIKVSNVPVQKNHRTNILGNLFTDDVNFNVIIDERFDQPDNNINYPEVTDVVYWNNLEFETIEAAYNAALAANQTDIVISLAKGTYTMDNNFAFENPNKVTNVTVQGATGVNPADIIINGRFAMSASSAQKVATGSSMTIKGLTLTPTTTTNTKNDATHYYRSGSEKSSIYIFGGVKLTVEDCIFDIADPTQEKATGILTWGDQNTTAVVKNCKFNCDGHSKPLQIGHGSSNTIDNCTFNQPKKYAVQVNHYGPSETERRELIFKNNIINANPSKINYGIALDSRQEAYYNLDVTVENNVMNNPFEGSHLYSYGLSTNSKTVNGVTYTYSGAAAWETVTVNNGKENWGIYVP